MSVAPLSDEYEFRLPARPVLVATGRRHPGSADAAQARLFAALLEVEIAELSAYAVAAEEKWKRSHPDEARRPDGLARQHARVDEARRLLAALHERFALS
jgi:type II secretory pathway component PulK